MPAIQDIQDEEKQNISTTQYVLDTLYANKHKYVYKTSALMVDGSEFGNFVITLINNWKQRRNESRFIMLIVG